MTDPGSFRPGALGEGGHAITVRRGSPSRNKGTLARVHSREGRRRPWTGHSERARLSAINPRSNPAPTAPAPANVSSTPSPQPGPRCPSPGPPRCRSRFGPTQENGGCREFQWAWWSRWSPWLPRRKTPARECPSPRASARGPSPAQLRAWKTSTLFPAAAPAPRNSRGWSRDQQLPLSRTCLADTQMTSITGHLRATAPASVPSPPASLPELSVGSLTLRDGETVKGFGSHTRGRGTE